MHRLINGVRVELSEAEADAQEAEWAANRAAQRRPRPLGAIKADLKKLPDAEWRELLTSDLAERIHADPTLARRHGKPVDGDEPDV